jgi:dolichyl-phosphate beta-glucosyltransferase
MLVNIFEGPGVPAGGSKLMAAILDTNAGDGKAMNASATPVLSIVIPAWNEARRVPQSLLQIRDYFNSHPLDVEILLMVERSQDDTLDRAGAVVEGDTRFQVIDNLVHRGKGYAVRSGVLRARGDIVLFMDADLSTPLEEVQAFLAHFQQQPDTDVLIGSRALARSRVEKPQSALRRNMGRIFNALVQTLSVPGITDTQCGFKAFRRDAARAIFSRQTLDGFAFDVEVLMLARALDMRVDVLPVRWLNSPDSSVHIVRDSWRMFRDLLRVRARVRRTLRRQPVGADPVVGAGPAVGAGLPANTSDQAPAKGA